MSRPAAVRSRRREPFASHRWPDGAFSPGRDGEADGHGQATLRSDGDTRAPRNRLSTSERAHPTATVSGLPDAFVCVHCGVTVLQDAAGTGHRNHCPRCLWSRHVDVRPGDRANLCRAPMEPVALWIADHGEIRVIHRCTRCGTLKANRVAGDDSAELLVELSNRAARLESPVDP